MIQRKNDQCDNDTKKDAQCDNDTKKDDQCGNDTKKDDQCDNLCLGGVSCIPRKDDQ